jgi:hypothetical protein
MMITHITRPLRAFWHRRDVKWLLGELGLADLAALDELLAEPFTAAGERFLETRERILARRNPMKLVQEAVQLARIGRVTEAIRA